MTKVIHCPTFARKLFGTIDKLDAVSSTMDALLFSMYYAAVSTCTARETRRRFGENQDLLLKRYGQRIESALSNNYDVPTIEQLQALVLYIASHPRATSLILRPMADHLVDLYSTIRQYHQYQSSVHASGTLSTAYGYERRS